MRKIKNKSPVGTTEKLLNKAYRFLSYRPRSEKEIRTYLKDKISKLKSITQNEELINSIIQKLKEQKFLDDVEFAKWWIEQRTIIRPRAWRIIKMELKNKGISEEIIMNQESRIMNQELETAMELAKKKIQKLKNLERKKAYEKIGRYLASKGFDWDTIKEVIDQILSK